MGKIQTVILDTNILFSALISPKGIAAKVIDRLIKDPDWQPVTSAYIINELQMLRQKKYFPKKTSEASMIEYLFFLVDNIPTVEPQLMTSTYVTLPHSSVDEKDEHVWAALKAIAGNYLLTFNTKHFPDTPQVVTPAELLQQLI